MPHGDDLSARASLVAQPDTALLKLTGEDLTLDQLLLIARRSVRLAVSDKAKKRINQARSTVDSVCARGDVVYGLNTELGPFVKIRVGEDQIEQFQMRTLVGHAVAHGSRLDTHTVRAMMVMRANGLARGGAGVRLAVVEKLVELLNNGVHPVVLSGSSVGQSDLSDMAQIAQVLTGHGQAEYEGKIQSAGKALAAASITPLTLAAKEALALISANGFTIGRGSLVVADAITTMHAFELSAALALEAFQGNLSVLHPAASELKPHPGHKKVAERLRALLAGSYLWQPKVARNLQDPLSFRCIPLVHGALDEAVTGLKAALEIELNSASDNPLVSIEDNTIVCSGNFDVTNVAIGFDYLRIALTHVINLSNERIQKELWPYFSGLPTGLERRKDPSSRIIPLARTAAALTSEAQVLAHPASLAHSAQIAEGIEDHASQGPLSVKRTDQLIRIARQVAALEFLVSTAAIALRDDVELGEGTRRVVNFIQQEPWQSAQHWHTAIERLTNAIASGELTDANFSDIEKIPYPPYKVRPSDAPDYQI